MGENSGISWTDDTLNAQYGCTQIPGKNGAPSGCDRCYAKTLIDDRMSRNPTSRLYGKRFEQIVLAPERLEIPLRQKRGRKIFVNSLSDLFHVKVPDSHIDATFEMMRLASQHTFQVLTKRPERMRSYMRKYGIAHGGHTPPNVWLGTSICTNDDSPRAEVLRRTDGHIRWVSAEPLLGLIDAVDFSGMNWVVLGGESGRGARMMQAEWLDRAIDAARAAGAKIWVKQLGTELALSMGIAGKGDEPELWPRRWQIQEFPSAV